MDSFETNTWLDTVDVLQRNMTRMDRMLFFGDYFLGDRIHAWSTHAPDTPALLAKKVRRPINQLKAFVYQLTRRGRKLRERGLDWATDAPPMYMGGWTLYGEKPTWVRRDRKHEWWLESLDRQ